MDYKEKLQDIINSDNTPFVDINTFLKYFPELKESEDERIRKELIEFVKSRGGFKQEYIAWLEKQSTPQVRTGLEWVNTIDDACDKRYSEEYAHGEYCHEQSFKWGFQEGVDWLEKQGEQKPANWFQELEDKLANATPKQLAEWKEKYFKEAPAEWSEEDEAKLKSILFHIEDVENKNVIDWLKSLKDRVQPKQEILEKLEEWLDEYVSDLADVDTASLICSFTNYLDGKLPKSLKPQPQWKPSEQQLKTLQVAIDIIGEGTLVGTDLKELSEQLKKLREE